MSLPIRTVRFEGAQGQEPAVPFLEGLNVPVVDGDADGCEWLTAAPEHAGRS